MLGWTSLISNEKNAKFILVQPPWATETHSQQALDSDCLKQQVSPCPTHFLFFYKNRQKHVVCVCGFFDNPLTVVQQLFSERTGDDLGRRTATLCAFGGSYNSWRCNKALSSISRLCAVTVVTDPDPLTQCLWLQSADCWERFGSCIVGSFSKSKEMGHFTPFIVLIKRSRKRNGNG